MLKGEPANFWPIDFYPQPGPNFKCIGEDILIRIDELKAAQKVSVFLPAISEGGPDVISGPGKITKSMAESQITAIFQLFGDRKKVVEIEPKLVGSNIRLLCMNIRKKPACKEQENPYY
jgi:hypothetical protein